MTLLHVHPESSGFSFPAFSEAVFLHGFLDTIKIIPFLFLTYLLMEFIEHKASDKFTVAMEKSGHLAPFLSGLLGTVPQCGFSAAVAGFYTGGIVTVGTLIAVFLSTSDEMLPILISGRIGAGAVFTILGYKTAVGILIGFITDAVLRLLKYKRREINIDDMCSEEGCQCKRGIFRSALHHTLKIGAFLLAVTLIINSLVYFVGNDNIARILYDKPVISHMIAALLGLIPSCAVSVALTDFFVEGYITAGTMIAGLLPAAGVGLLVLFKTNKSKKENFAIVGVLVLSGIIFGILLDLMNFSVLR